MNGEISTPQTCESDGVISKAKCERIKACIDSFLEKNPRLTLQSIENKTGLRLTTLRRIMNLNGNPNPENVIKLCLALGFDQELEKYLIKYHPEIATLKASKSHNKDYDYMPENETQYFTEESNFLILSLAYTTAGATEEELRFEVGERGMVKTQELIEKGLLLRTEDGRYIGKMKNFKLPFADVKKEIELALKHYRLEEAGAMNNFINYQTESLSPEGLKILKALEQKQAIERRELVFNNKALQGINKAFVATVSSTFVAYNPEGDDTSDKTNSTDSSDPEVLQ